MIAHLVGDVVRRQRPVYLAMFVPLTVWVGIGGGYLDLSLGLTLTLFFAVFAGPFSAMAALGLREIRVLPIAARDLWRATWTISTGICVLWAVVSAGAGLGLRWWFAGSLALRPETLILVALYAFAHAGVVVAAAPLVGYSAHWATERQPRWLWTVIAVVVFIGFFGMAFGGPYLLATRLPTRLDQLTPLTTAMIAVWAAVAISPLAWTPTRGGSFAVGPLRPAPVVRGSASRRRFSDRFTGVGRILWTHFASIVVIGAAAIVLFAAYVKLSPTVDRLELLNELLPIPLVIVYMQHVWAPWARRLKTLPISVNQINALFLATSAGVWLVGAAMLAILCAALDINHPILQWAVVVAGCGFLAFAHSLLFRFQRQPWLFVAMIGFLTATTRKMLSATGSIEGGLALTGVIALAAAAGINYRTLTRSTSASPAYQRMRNPFGVTSGPR